MPTNSEAIFAYIREFPGRDDDEIARALRISPRQQVNQLCRRLEKEGRIRRASGATGKIENYPALTRPAAQLPPPARPSEAVEGGSVPNGGDIFSLQDLGPDRLSLVRIALRHCLFPEPRTVASFGGAVFPSIRDQKNRLTLGEIDGRGILLDDNVTPRWALLWAHGVSATHHLAGWTFAHIWGASRDPNAYTNLANLCMMPEFFGSLSDKQGPLCAYLRYHAWDCYGWRYGDTELPKPDGYDTLEWRYLPAIENPVAFVRGRLNALSNQRVLLLRSLM